MPIPLFRCSHPVRRELAVEAWIVQHADALGAIAGHWFTVIRRLGDDVREELHDGCLTACVADAAFAYVNAFKAHVNVGLFRGAELADSAGQLEAYRAGAAMRSRASIVRWLDAAIFLLGKVSATLLW